MSNLEIIKPKKVEGIYQMPTEVMFGRGALREIVNQTQFEKSGKIVLVTGGHFRGTVDDTRLIKGLVRDDKEIVIYEPVIKKSDFETINGLTDFVRSEKPDLIIAMGGGTILDTSKCAAILAINGGLVKDYVKDKTRQLEKKGISLLVVPTTAGTGSEVTPWAAVWDSVNKDKYSLTSPLMFPDLAIVDPSLTDGLSPKVTAESGIDALTQAIEAYWSLKHNLVSDEFALEAIRLAMTTLENVVKKPNQEARDKMAKAALLAGLAFSNTQTTICHSVSYPMTAHFEVAHGQAVAITLPTFIEYSLPVLEDERKKALLDAIGAGDDKQAVEKITKLMKNCGLAVKLSDLGIKVTDIDLIVSKGFHPDRAKNAPRIPTPVELKRMLLALL